MKRTLGIILLTSAALASAACDESPTGLPRGDNQVRPTGLRVEIVGPALVQAPGEYEWIARVVGADDETLAYEWSVFDMGGSTELITSTDPVLTLSLDPGDLGGLQIELVVRAGSEQASATEVIGVCEVRHAMEWCIPTVEIAAGR